LTTALFAGRFDPVTNGHLDTALRAAELFDEVVIGVAESKSTLFSTEERVELFRGAVEAEGMKNTRVEAYTGLTVDFARSVSAKVLIRSMRGNTDFEQEFDQALMNRKMAPEIESMYLIARLEHLFISGTRIREVAGLGYDVTGLVPAHVAEALKRKFGEARSS
jgi:pantetheine-phosphate adenylyltransferase